MKTLNLADIRKALEARRADPALKAAIPGGAALNFDRAVEGDPKKRTLRFLASDETWDDYNTRFRVAGWMTDRYEANPILLWGHDRFQPAVGGHTALARTRGGLYAEPQFPTREEYPFADTLYRLYSGGYMRGISVGFSPVEAELLPDPESGEYTRVDFLRTELLELSLVTLPGNPNALLTAVRAGDVDKEGAADFAARAAFRGMLDDPQAREALSLSVRRLAKDPSFEKEITLALRSLAAPDGAAPGASGPARSSAQPAAVANQDWAAPLNELRAMNQALAKR